MKRVVWIAVTILIMIGIMGYALHTMKNISKVNQERREKEAAKQEVSQIVIVPETTNIYDKLRPTETSETAEGEAVPLEGETETTEQPGVMHAASVTTAAPEEAEETEASMPAEEAGAETESDTQEMS